MQISRTVVELKATLWGAPGDSLKPFEDMEKWLQIPMHFTDG